MVDASLASVLRASGGVVVVAAMVACGGADADSAASPWPVEGVVDDRLNAVYGAEHVVEVEISSCGDEPARGPVEAVVRRALRGGLRPGQVIEVGIQCAWYSRAEGPMCGLPWPISVEAGTSAILFLDHDRDRRSRGYSYRGGIAPSGAPENHQAVDALAELVALPSDAQACESVLRDWLRSGNSQLVHQALRYLLQHHELPERWVPVVLDGYRTAGRGQLVGMASTLLLHTAGWPDHPTFAEYVDVLVGRAQDDDPAIALTALQSLVVVRQRVSGEAIDLDGVTPRHVRAGDLCMSRQPDCSAWFSVHGRAAAARWRAWQDHRRARSLLAPSWFVR